MFSRTTSGYHGNVSRVVPGSELHVSNWDELQEAQVVPAPAFCIHAS